jgi:hypothetical protein
MATITNTVEITYTASAPYRTLGFQGNGRYGVSAWQKRDYTATCPVCGTYFKQTVKDTARDVARGHAARVHDAKALVTFVVKY